MSTRAILLFRAITLLTVLLAACGTTSGDIRELGSDDADDRQEALVNLGERMEEGVSEKEREKIIVALHRSLDDRNSVVRMIATDVLGKSGHRESIPKIVPLLEDKAWGTRHAAIKALRKLEAKGEGAGIARVLREDPNKFCRLAAAKTIKAFRAEEGIEACIVALSERESDTGVQLAAWEALKAISGQDLPQRPEAWRRWWADYQAGKAGKAGKTSPAPPSKEAESP